METREDLRMKIARGTPEEAMDAFDELMTRHMQEDKCDICGALVDEKSLRSCAECRTRFCPECDADDDVDLCIDCEDELEE